MIHHRDLSFPKITDNNVDESENEGWESTRAHGKTHREPSLLNEFIYTWKKPEGASGWKDMHQNIASILWK